MDEEEAVLKDICVGDILIPDKKKKFFSFYAKFLLNPNAYKSTVSMQRAKKNGIIIDSLVMH
jgi:hypothetical protein